MTAPHDDVRSETMNKDGSEVVTAPAPTVPGFYWAKWRIAAEDTDDNGGGCGGANAKWEVVDVWENCLDPEDDEYLMVHVPGVAKSQPIENFFWGPGPLTPPPDRR